VKSIYLAGPDVFLPNATQRFDAMEEKCAALGIFGMRPSDGGLSTGSLGSGEAMAERIYRANVELIQRADAVIANLMPFRGAVEPDSGTVFEIGMAVALGKPVAGYLPMSSTPYEKRVGSHFNTKHDATGALRDDQGLLVESFGEPLNLMLSRSVRLFDNFDEALEHIASVLNHRPLKSLCR
jgi:nucleoside 2-deoxyribosyltransferase